MNAHNIENGTELRFLDDEAFEYGIVNGPPHVCFAGGNARCYVPVHVRDGNRNVLVDIDNIFGVVEHSVKV